ncbi:MAG TPA: hypothetical protein VKZ18_21970 [Polyangia bacterium]|nr:hypothetical protein [Polyangia bacterium]
MDRLLVGAVLGSLVVGCASVEYRVPASEMVRLAQISPAARGDESRVVPASTPMGPPLTAAAVAPHRPSVPPEAEPVRPEEPGSAEAVVVDTEDPPDADPLSGWSDVTIAVDATGPPPRPAPAPSRWHGAPVASRVVATPVRVAPVRAAVAGAPPSQGLVGSGGHHAGAGGGDMGALGIAALIVLPIVIVAVVAEASRQAPDARAFDGWVTVSPDHLLHLRYAGDVERLVPLTTLCPSDLVGVRYAVLREDEGRVERRARVR